MHLMRCPSMRCSARPRTFSLLASKQAKFGVPERSSLSCRSAVPSGPMSSPHVLVVENPDAVAHAAQRLFIDAATEAMDAKGAFTVGFSGGSTPRLLFRLLAKGAGTVPPEWPFDWSKVHVFFVDERCVPPTHEESNYGMARAE